MRGGCGPCDLSPQPKPALERVGVVATARFRRQLVEMSDIAAADQHVVRFERGRELH